MQTFDRPFALVSDSTLDLGEGEELGALEVVKIGQAVKRCMLGLRQHGQPFAVAGTCRLVGLQLGLGRLEAGKNFPYNVPSECMPCPCEVSPCLSPAAELPPNILFGKVGAMSPSPRSPTPIGAAGNT